MEPPAKLSSIVPRVALIINLSPSVEAGPDTDKCGVVAAEIRNLGLPATWIVDGLRPARYLGAGQLATTATELALTASARSPQRLRSELSNRQAALQAETGQAISVIVGNPQQLRARAALLADLGIRSVVSHGPAAARATLPRRFPCGLWQFDPAITLPETGRCWSLLPARQLTAARLLTIGAASEPIVVAIEPGRFSARCWQNCQRLLQEIAAASRRQQLAIATISAVAAQLANQREVKPQRSILRGAA